MTTGNDFFETGGLSSGKWWVQRRTGDPRSDVLLDRLTRAQSEEERIALALEIHRRLGEACAEYPLFIPAQAHKAISFVLRFLGEDEEGEVADNLFREFLEADNLRSDQLSAAEFASELSDLAASADSGSLFGMTITDAAESLGRCCAASVAEIVERLSPFAAIARDTDERDLRSAAERGRAYRHACHYEANAASIELLAAGKPFEIYEVDVELWSPSPLAYHAELAERKALARAEADEAIVQTAEADVAEGVDTAILLSIARATARETLASPISVGKLGERLLTASGVGTDQALARAIEVSIEVAREDREESLRDYVIVERVETILAADRSKVAAALPHVGVAVTTTRGEEPIIKREVFAAAAEETPAFVPVPILASGLTPEEEIEALTRVPGLVGDLVDWICATSRTPNRTLAFSAALVFLGTVAGRLYKSPTGLRTNLYTLGLAPSGFGKDAARKCIDSLATEGGFSEWIGGDNIASGPGMRKRVEQHPAIMWKIDEFGGFMRKIGDARASHHTAQIRDYLLTYFGSAGSVFRGEDYAGERGVPCHHPNVGIYGTSTPIDFWGACQSLSVGDGLLARFVIFTVSERKRPKSQPASADYEAPPAALVARCRAVAKPKCGGNLAHLMDGSRPSKPMLVPYGAGAEAAFESMVEAFADRADAADREEEAFWNRAVENAVKIALVLAIGEDPDRPVLTIESLRVGRRVVELCIENTLREVKGRLADNDRQREHIYVRRLIEEAGPSGITRTALCQKLNGRFPAARRDDILRTLEEDEKVIITRLGDNTRGPRGARFIAVRHLGKDQAT